MRNDTKLFLFSTVATAVVAVSLVPLEVRSAKPAAAQQQQQQQQQSQQQQQQQPQQAIRTIAPAEAYANLRNGNILLLDVRTPAEYAERRIPGSVLVPLDGGTEPFAQAIRKRVPNLNEPVYVYCRSGRRSRAAVEIMMGLGYKNVLDLGGIIDWPYPTESGQAK